MEQPGGRAGGHLGPQVWSSGVMEYFEMLNLSGCFLLQVTYNFIFLKKESKLPHVTRSQR